MVFTVDVLARELGAVLGDVEFDVDDDDIAAAFAASRVLSPSEGSNTWWPPFIHAALPLVPNCGEVEGERDTGDMASTGLKAPLEDFPFLNGGRGGFGSLSSSSELMFSIPQSFSPPLTSSFGAGGSGGRGGGGVTESCGGGRGGAFSSGGGRGGSGWEELDKGINDFFILPTSTGLRIDERVRREIPESTLDGVFTLGEVVPCMPGEDSEGVRPILAILRRLRLEKG